MVRLRWLVICCVLVLGVSVLQATSLSKYLLPDTFFKDWVSQKANCSDTSLIQIWNKPLNNMPKGTSGYLMVMYQASDVESADQAADEAKKISSKDQFGALVGKGYTVTGEPWAKFRENGMVFTIRGLAHTEDQARTQVAIIYNLAFSKDSRVVWLQVREAGTAEELNIIDRAFKKAGGEALAEELASFCTMQWQLPEKTVISTPTPPTVPDKNDVTINATQTPPAPAASNNTTVTTPTPPTPPKADAPAAVAPTPVPTPTTVPAATPPVTPPAPEAPQTPPAAVDVPKTPPAPAAAPVAPDKPDAQRWAYENNFLSLILPTGWKVTPKAPFLFSGIPHVDVYLYPWESYKNDDQRDRTLKSFVADQQDIALKNFSQKPFTPDGSLGVMVSYTNVEKNTVYIYRFAKSGRFWQILVSLPGENIALPGVITDMLESLRVQ